MKTFLISNSKFKVELTLLKSFSRLWFKVLGYLEQVLKIHWWDELHLLIVLGVFNNTTQFSISQSTRAMLLWTTGEIKFLVQFAFHHMKDKLLLNFVQNRRKLQ